MFAFGMASHQGLVRRENQDAWGKFPEQNFDLAQSHGHLFVVADGLGGHQGGKVASALAVNTLAEFFRNTPDLAPAEFWRGAFDAANQRIFTQSFQDMNLHGMGTTCSAILMKANRLSFAHVGDSRIYRLRNQELQQLTTDHTLQQERLPPAAPGEERRRITVITRALGTQPVVEIDCEVDMALAEGDCFILCSDGLYSEVNETAIQQVVQNHPPPAACEKLIELANANGGRDNVTVGVIKIVSLNDKMPAMSPTAGPPAAMAATVDLQRRWWRRFWRKIRPTS